MSWFGTSNITSLAKSALREAQRTIDKALDIKDDDLSVPQSNVPIDTDSDDLFAALPTKKDNEDNSMATIQNSLWGSFTGSFFDVEQAKSPSVDSLDDSTDARSEQFSSSKLVVVPKSESDSIELLPCSEDTTPDSVFSTDFQQSSHTDEATSPSIEVLLSEEPQEMEGSLAEDRSCASEGTSATTVLDSSFQQNAHMMLKDTYESVDAITRAPSRGVRDQLTMFTNTNVIDIPRDAAEEVRSDTETNEVETKMAEAMVERQQERERPNSPVSSESLVKIGSDHTSGDELETTTSSDIEIISSPNCCDSSSTQSRHSPIKSFAKPKTADLCKITLQKSKGHTRELSEASSDDSHSEVDRLIKRLNEMTEILESRESKLADVNRRNTELHELNDELKRQLDSILIKQSNVDIAQVTEEYTQRLSALEKKFQQAIRDKDELRKQLDQTKTEIVGSLSRSEVDTLLQDKDDTIKELREEGEKLSKQHLQHSNIIKKLRAKEKENEGIIKNLKESIHELTSESERLKRSLAAKEEVERSQIEAIHQLSAKNKKLETEIGKLRGQFDDLSQKYDTSKTSLEAAKKELADRRHTSTELMAREHKLESLENEKRMTESQNQAIINELDDLRAKLRSCDALCAKKEQNARKEHSELLRRLEEAEAKNEELSQSVLEVSKPLVRQLESLQATHNHKVATFEKIEREMSQKISELQTRLQTTSNGEKSAREQLLEIRTRIADLESELSSVKHRNELMTLEIEQLKTERLVNDQKYEKQLSELNDELASAKSRSNALSLEKSKLEEELSLEKSRSNEMQSSIDRGRHSGSNSPTLSIGKLSVAESLTGSLWSQDEAQESGPPRYTNMFEMQMLQTGLKQRDGELQQLHWELNRREQERALLNAEISQLLTRVEQLELSLKDYESVKVEHEKVQKEYETLCQLFGEKVEEYEELKLDLDDVKEAYKSQIDDLLKQQKMRNA